jgi:nucleotide-binding universal stress UspA family protein
MSDYKNSINPDGSVIPDIGPENHKSKETAENYSISKDNIPSIKKILVTDDGKVISNKAINYSLSLSNYTEAELIILRILEDVDMLEDVSVEGSNSSNSSNNNTETAADQDFKRTIKGDIIDSMEDKIKKSREAGFQNKVSYKFLAGNNAVDEIINEIKNDTKYDLLVLSTSHIDSWFRTLFSDARKIISGISIPVLVVQ